MVVVGGMDTVWKPGGGRMSEKSSLLSDDAASSSENMSTTAGCKEVMCVRRAYTNSQHRGFASCTHLRRSLCRIWGGEFPRKVEIWCEPLEFNSKPAKYYFYCRALTYDVKLITKDPRT